MPTPPPAEQFWLLTGEVPSGPFTVAQVHAELAAGRANWQTPACPVGGATWLPLVQTPGIGPTDGPPAIRPEGNPSESAAKPPKPPPLSPGTSGATNASTGGTAAVGTPNPRPPSVESSVPSGDDPAAAPVPPATPNAAGDRAELVGVAIGIGILVLLVAGVGYGVYWAYEQLRPYTATEVCKKLDEVKTAVEARKYTTPRMHPFIDATYADKSALDPNDNFEWTQEVDGPQANTKLVGFRGTWFDQEAGQRVRVEGHCRVVRADGWKVDDMIITGVEGASLPGPVSLVDEHRRSVTAPKAPASPSGGPANRGGATKAATTTPRPSPVDTWYERNKKYLGFLVVGLLMVLGKAISDARKK